MFKDSNIKFNGLALLVVLFLILMTYSFSNLFHNKNTEINNEEVEYDRIINYGDNSDFKKLVNSNQAVLVELKTNWCGYCKELETRLPSLVDSMDYLTVVKVDIEKYPEFEDKYKVIATPTLLLFRDGRYINEYVGSVDNKRIKEWVESGYIRDLN